MNKPASTHLYSAFLVLAGLLVAACSPVNLLNSVIPNGSYSLNKDIAYGDSTRQKLDIYTPKKADRPASGWPVVLFFYGGNWDSGNKKDYLFAAEAFTASGFMVVIPDYRVYPEVAFPAFMADPANAAKWVKAHIADYGGSADQVFIVGHSAGAHIAMLLNLDHRYLNQVGLNAQQFRGFIGLAGPYDFLPLKSQHLKDIFGDDANQQAAQPINFVTGDNPPTLLLVGLKDGTVWPRNTYNLAAAIRAKHGPVEVAEFADYGHIDMVAKLAKPFRGNSQLLQTMVQFMHQQLQLNEKAPILHP